MPRLETFLMPAGFSSIVGEFMNLTIPRYCTDLVKNKYHRCEPRRGAEAVPVQGRLCRQTGERGLEFFGSLGHQSPDDHSER
jgi:hypothetical protein